MFGQIYTKFFLLFCVLAFANGCERGSKPSNDATSDRGFKVKVKHEMGTLVSDSLSIIPNLFDIVSFETGDCQGIVLRGSGSNKSMYVYPLALLSFDSPKGKENWIVNYALNSTNESTNPPKSLLDLATKNPSLKIIIEHYFINSYPLGELNNLKWQDEGRAIQFMKTCLSDN